MRKLLRGIDFLFELPRRFNQCVEEHNYPQAAYYYKGASRILRRHSQIGNLNQTMTTLDRAVDRMILQIKEEIRSTNVNREMLREISSILKDVHRDDEEMISMMLDTYSQQLNHHISQLSATDITLDAVESTIRDLSANFFGTTQDLISVSIDLFHNPEDDEDGIGHDGDDDHHHDSARSGWNDKNMTIARDLVNSKIRIFLNRFQELINALLDQVWGHQMDVSY